TGAAMDNYLKLVRWPLDAATRLLPGERVGPRAAARLGIDRLDATIRGLVGRGLGNDALRHSSGRRAEAAEHRDHALRLRRQAQDELAAAQEQLEEADDAAVAQRKRATAKASSRKSQASQRRQEKVKQARSTEANQRQAAQVREQRSADKIEAEEARDLLPAVREQAQAAQQRADALDERDEAERLGAAAARVKRARKLD
ncbi:MAG: hypothetical protein ACRDNK_11500, partial [Solirubrobacteraceae bacterium]